MLAFLLPLLTLLPYVAPVCLTDTHPLEAILITDTGLATRVWWDRLGTASDDFSCYEPDLTQLSPGWQVLGHLPQPNHLPVSSTLMAFRDCELEGQVAAFANPVGFTRTWDDSGSTHLQDGSAWRINCPYGYSRLSDFFYPANGISYPEGLLEKVSCVREDLVDTCDKGSKVWQFKLPLVGGKEISVWRTAPNTTTSLGGPFLYTNQMQDAPPGITFKCLKKSAYSVL